MYENFDKSVFLESFPRTLRQPAEQYQKWINTYICTRIYVPAFFAEAFSDSGIFHSHPSSLEFREILFTKDSKQSSLKLKCVERFIFSQKL